MMDEYARIALSIGKLLSKRQQAIAKDPLPPQLAKLLSSLSESEEVEDSRQTEACPMHSRLFEN